MKIKATDGSIVLSFYQESPLILFPPPPIKSKEIENVNTKIWNHENQDRKLIPFYNRCCFCLPFPLVFIEPWSSTKQGVKNPSQNPLYLLALFLILPPFWHPNQHFTTGCPPPAPIDMSNSSFHKLHNVLAITSFIWHFIPPRNKIVWCAFQ